MEEKDIEAIKRKKMLEIKVRAVLRKILDDKAYDRMSNVKVANEELYFKAAELLAQYYQRVGRKLTEEDVLKVLRLIKGEERETRIIFKRK